MFMIHLHMKFYTPISSGRCTVVMKQADKLTYGIRATVTLSLCSPQNTMPQRKLHISRGSMRPTEGQNLTLVWFDPHNFAWPTQWYLWR